MIAAIDDISRADVRSVPIAIINRDLLRFIKSSSNNLSS